MHILILALTACFFFSCKKPLPLLKDFNKDWKFKIHTTDNNSDFHLPKTDVKNWESIHLPHSAKIEPLLVNNQWQGICWYRKDFPVSNEYENKKMFLEFEGAMNFSEFWINGKKITSHQGGYLPVVIDITDHVTIGSTNTIAVRLDNTDNLVTGPKPLKRLDFNMYGGLYRKVNFTTKNNVYISNPTLANKVAGGGIFITYPKVSKSVSDVHIKTHVVNESEGNQKVQLVNEVYFKEQLIKTKTINKTIKKGHDITLENDLTIQKPNLWSPKNPNLYVLKTSLLVDNKVVDNQSTKFGIRSFTFKKNQLYINGEKTFLRGVNRHQEYPFIGYALSDNAQYRDAKKIKESGFDYIRLSHYPHSPAFMDACDELGIVVIDAIMGWQYYGDNDAFRNYCYQSAKNLIRRDRNHPCVLAWETSLNETKMPTFFMQKLDAIVHAEYPGKNVYSCGWMNEVYDIYLQARQHRILHHYDLDEINKKPYSVSEYGDWEYFSTNAGFNQDRKKFKKNERLLTCSRQLREAGEKQLLQQAHNLQESHNDNLSTPAYSDSYWVMYDYNRGYHNSIESSGVSDIFRIPKFGYYFYKSQRDITEDKVIKIASYWTPKSNTTIKVFSNAETVKLFLNEKLIAEQKPDTDSISNHLNHPPFTFNLDKFTPGVLKAVGIVNGKEIMKTEIKTPESPVALKLWIDESGKKPEANVNDVVFAYIAAVDKNGTIIPTFSDNIDITITGDAKVMNYKKIVKAEAGIATVLLQIGDAKEAITIAGKTNALDREITFNSVSK